MSLAKVIEKLMSDASLQPVESLEGVSGSKNGILMNHPPQSDDNEGISRGSSIVNDGEAARADMRGAVGCEKARHDPDEAREQVLSSDSPNDAVDGKQCAP